MKQKKKSKSFALALRLRARAATLLIALLCGVTGAWAKTLTVYEDASVYSEYVPVNGWYADNYLKCEFVIPATKISAMEGGTISQMTFYLKQSATKAWTGTFQVFLKEVNSTTIDAYSGTEGATTVYTGTLDATGSTMTIPFSTIYTYRGGNLLVGIYETAIGNYDRAYFYGVTATGASGQYYISSSLDDVSFFQRNYIPKTTFTYTPAPGTAVDLGLPSGKKWADRNVGAGSETDYGTYYAWSSSDIATAQWGVNWRMPTLTEAQELINNTDQEWATIGGVNGMKYMKKTDHSVYIFLPAAGWDGNTNVGTKGTYWTSTTLEADANKAYELYHDETKTTTGNDRKTFQFTVRPVQMFAGAGTESSPYLIASTTDWNNLSAAVNAGTEYSGIYFKLTANISVTTMIGASDKPFRGSFDGGGHTLTVNYTASAAGTAPFSRTASTTLIKNLRVVGTITGGDFKVAGLVSEPAGATIEHCRVSATISANTYHGLWIGGFCNGGNVTINNCLFDGKINCVGGGFIGYSETTSRITNCLFAPQTGSSLVGSSQDGNGVFIYTKGRESNLGTITNCYYTSLAGGVAQGTDGSGLSAVQLVQNLGASNWKVVGGNAIPKVHPNLSGLGTEASPYLIASTTDWNNLVSAVNAGETYSGNYFKMTANVGTVSTWMTGTFSGTFDGDGKTLTVDYTATSQRCGAFGYLGSASIQNLKVAGTISTAYQAAGGLATWCNEGASAYITNCRVSTIISSSVSGDGTHGGFVAYTDGKLYFTGCVFDGSLTGSTTNACSGFVYNSGWNGAAVSLTDCLLAPSSVTIGTGASATFVRGTAPTITNCYYTQTLGTAQGLQARTIAKGDYVSTLSVTKGAATETYDVSGITVYSSGIDFNDGSTTTFYGGSGQTVSLDLTAATRSGYRFKQYAASQGTLSGETTNAPTLIMPAANSTANDVVTISAEYDPTYNADFADGNDNTDWTIDPTSGVEGTSVTVSYTGENKVKSVTVAPKGALTGKFSVSSTKQVQFSKGNLQYDGSAWSFHTNQYDCVFTSNGTATGYPMDIFCWGNIDAPAYDGSTGIGTNGVDLSGSSDWGSNTITNGCTGWRTLTWAEWEYLFANHSYGYATVAGQTGVIILPDVFTDPMRNNGSAAFVASTASWTANVYAAGDDWTAMEKAGALFLPAAGGRDGASIKSIGINGSYWSSTADTVHGHFITFEAGSAPVTTYVSIHKYGKSVRLVKDVE